MERYSEEKALEEARKISIQAKIEKEKRTPTDKEMSEPNKEDYAVAEKIIENDPKEYHYTLDSLRTSIYEAIVIGQEQLILKKYARALYKPGAFKPSESKEENKAIIDFVSELQNKYRVYVEELPTALSRFINIDLYNRQELVDIIESKPFFAHGILVNGAHIIFGNLSNEEITDFCTNQLFPHWTDYQK